MDIDFVAYCASVYLGKTVDREAAETLANELGNREEFLAWLLLRSGAEIRDTSLWASVYPQRVAPFDHVPGKSFIERTRDQQSSLETFEHAVLEAIAADQGSHAKVRLAENERNAYFQVHSDGAASIADIAVMRRRDPGA